MKPGNPASLREATQMALEALEIAEYHDEDRSYQSEIETLRAALEAEPQEPVAYLMRNKDYRDMQSLHWTPQTHWHPSWEALPLYAAPQADRDKKRLDWLERQKVRQMAYDTSETQIFTWVLTSKQSNLREAIDAVMKAQEAK